MKSNLNLVALGSVCALISIALGCNPSVPENAAVDKASNVVNTDFGNANTRTESPIQSANSSGNIIHSTDNRVEISQRLWQDFEYLFSTQATLIGFTPDNRSIKLLKANGVDIEVDVSILCDEDQEYLDSIPDQQRHQLSARSVN